MDKINWKEVKTPPIVLGTIKENNERYKWVSKNGKTILVHRLIWEEHFGEIPKGMIIHHKNHNKKDNRIDNLELVKENEHWKSHRKNNQNI